PGSVRAGGSGYAERDCCGFQRETCRQCRSQRTRPLVTSLAGGVAAAISPCTNRIVPKPMRVIAGQFRSRQLKSLKGLALRPTSDRLRETLFNVLAPLLVGSRFIDIFAGTGAIG